MAEEPQATTPRALWVIVLLPLALGAIAMEVNYVLVRQACSAQRNLMLYAVTLVALVLIVITAMVAFAIWRRAGADWPSGANDVATSVRFVSVLGVLNSVMMFLMIFAQGIATVQFDPCQL